jgi:hypothetical protein
MSVRGESKDAVSFADMDVGKGREQGCGELCRPTRLTINGGFQKIGDIVILMSASKIIGKMGLVQNH